MLFIALAIQVFVRDGTCVSALPLVLFGGEIDVRHIQSEVVVDRWLKLGVAAQHAALVVALRGKLQEIMKAKVSLSVQQRKKCCGWPYTRTCLLLVLVLAVCSWLFPDRGLQSQPVP